jgi:transposase
MQVTTVGLDLAKNIFQVHGVTSDGTVAFDKSLRREQLLRFFETLEPCLIGMEACGSSHHWARQFQKLGHEVRLMPAMYVKAYVKRGKSDAIDAEAICEAVTRPTMRFVAIKTEEQQGVLFLHRARDLVVRQRTQLSNMLRGLLGDFGIVIAQGIGSAVRFAKAVLDGDRPSIPEVAIDVLTNLSNQMVALHLRILWYDKRILLEGRRSPPGHAAANNSWGRSGDRLGHCCDSGRRASVPQWTRICRLAGPDTYQSIQWRQRTFGKHI